MTSHNEITGDKLQTKPATKEYRDNFDAIFRKSAEFNIEKEIKKQNKAYLEMLLIYSNGEQKKMPFTSEQEASWFVHNEGDHLVSYTKVNEEDTCKHS
jgi:hypothetical protein